MRITRPAAGLAACAVLAGLGLLAQARAAARDVAVDLQLVLAVDVSYSMDVEEQELQRAGYLSAITSKPVLDAIRSGRLGRVAVAYVEWSGADDQRTVVNWTLIDGEASAAGFAAKLAALPLHRAARTSISGALRHASGMFAGSGFSGTRRAIDVSGDGPNNEGGSVEEARDAALAQGVVVNGLPLLFKRPTYAAAAEIPLDDYYRACVIGGEGSFMLPIRDPAQFAEAIRTKLVAEIADRGSTIPAAFAGETSDLLIEAAIARDARCQYGGRLWSDE